ncbi:flavin reductase family protein [Trichlorobacter lovleyi]|uniref:flavin reductase family protein n=1 Tax=Trichlorobacter lovleyi TaxID=313985 RepID=UPI00223EC941|nr:flavin reductase family protein [Trichlorobacter lovleyi]QOX78077.1 flavin reductase family protein [Trichlorobacter lovleyi]
MKRSLGAATLSLPSPVWVIGSFDAQGQPNLMTVSWAGICCSDPPCVAISVRKNRLTHRNISTSGAFTVNVPGCRHLAQADLIGMVSGVVADKFATTGLTAVTSGLVNAPYVQEFPLNLECSVLHSSDLGSHTQFIGLICDVKADEEVLGKQGVPLAGLVQPVLASAPERSYYTLGPQLVRTATAGKALQPGKSAV